LEEWIEKTDKLRSEFSNQELSEAQAKEAAFLAHLRQRLYIEQKTSEERVMLAEKRKAEREEREREMQEQAAAIRALKELPPIEFTDCVGRYFKFPFISSRSWPVLLSIHYP
jgi:hypothetical protein